MRYVFTFFLLIISQLIFSQDIDFANYKPLQSTGNIPKVFTELSFERYNRRIGGIDESFDKTRLKERKDFLLKSNYHISEILHSGKVLFGDPISLYIRDVAKELLKNKPDVFNQLQFYTLQLSTPNASSTSEGIIFVNNGLISNLNNEAELAFVLAHEIAHYMAEDQINSYLKNIEIVYGKNRFVRKTWYDTFSKLGRYSREVELAADSLGTVLFLESGYSSINIINSLKRLYYSELPIKNVKFSTKFFNTQELTIPECFFAKEIPAIAEMKEFDDAEKTHPNIIKRIEKVKIILGEAGQKDKKDYLVSESKFKQIQKIAFFEQVRLNILANEYGKAIYNAYSLLLEHRDNKYLELLIAKALYGLARYSNSGELQKVAESYSKIEGESFQVHFLLRQLTKIQISAIALNYVWNLMQKQGMNNCLDQLETGLINDLVIFNELTLEAFNKPMPENNKIRVADDRNEYTAKELQRKFKDFYKPVFYNKPIDDRITKKFSDAFDKLRRKKDYEALSYKDKEKLKNQYYKMIHENGLNHEASEVFILDPFFDLDLQNTNKNLISSEKNKTDYEIFLKEITDKLEPKTHILSYYLLKENDVKTYNFISSYKDVFYEVQSSEIEGFYPIGAYIADDLKISDNKFLSINGIFDTNEGLSYYNLFIELKTGKIVYTNDKRLVNIRNYKVSADYLKNDILLFKVR